VKSALSAKASEFVMLDVMKIGGVTGWLRAAELAASHGVRVSKHLWPEISAQLLCLTSTAH
jgi:mandelate racemase